MAAATDPDILGLFRSGNRELAFQRLVEAHGKAVYNIALFTLNDETLAQDATQDAFIRIYRGLAKFKGDAKLSTWLYRIVKNVCYDILKKRRPFSMDEVPESNLMDEGGHSPEEQVLAAWEHQAVRNAVKQLPDSQRLAVTLYYFHDMSYDEVAAVMGQPLNTLKSYLHRARTALAKSLGQYQRSAA